MSHDFTLFPSSRARLIQAYQELADEQPVEGVESALAEFNEHWSVRNWENLTPPQLLTFFHGDGKVRGLFYELEFGKFAQLGSIWGGSSYKYRVFRSVSGDWKTTDAGNNSVVCSEEQAIVITSSLARDLAEALHLVEFLHLGSGDREQWRLFQSQVPVMAELGWFHKYLALSHPQTFSFVHNTELMQRQLVLLGVAPENGRWMVDWQWRELRLEDETLRDLDPVLISFAFMTWPRYWRVEVQEGWSPPAAIGIGWGHVGDLSQQIGGLGEPAARERLDKLLKASGSPLTESNDARQLYRFYAEISLGDRVVAMRGRHLLALGTVVGEYQYLASDALPHQRAVDWLAGAPPPFPTDLESRKTLWEFTKKFDRSLHVERLLVVAAPEPEPVHEEEPLDDEEARVRDILRRKGQVILYGPPGTGKTYQARKAARSIISRALFRGRSYASATPAEKADVDAHITFCTFHPSYSYEDFIEGFRPHANDGQAPTFRLHKGIFLQCCDSARAHGAIPHILIIDEINRGNIAPIMGELITLLEADKRNDLALVLPLSQQAFTVPTNLWIIGTMNTADRSISLLDAALRRRFGFYELLPAPHKLGQIDELSLSALLVELNARIRHHVSRNARELQIGHAYFMRRGDEPLDRRALLHIMRDEVIPLLQEYCFESWATLAAILGDDIIDEEGMTVRETVMSDANLLYAALLAIAPPVEAPAEDEEA